MGTSDQVIKAAWFPGELWITLGQSDGRIYTADPFNWDGNLFPVPLDYADDLREQGKIRDLQYTDDDSQLIAVTNQGYLAAWNLDENSWVLIRHDQIDNGSVYTVDWNPTGTS